MSTVKSESSVMQTAAVSGTMLHPQFASISLPSFDGRSPVRRFLDDFARYSRLHGWDDERKLDIFPLCLVGIARDAFDSLSTEQKGTFAGATAAFRASFVGRSSVDHHVALTALRFDPSGSLDAFVIEFKKLVALAFPDQPSEGILYNHFLSAVPDELGSAIIADGISTFDGAVRKVRNLCSAAKRLDPGVDRSEPVRHLAAAVDESLVARLERRIAELEARVDSVARGTSRGAASCFACGAADHFRSRCEHKNATCSKCQRRGHLSQVCGRYQGNARGFLRGATGEPTLGPRP